jgi:geranylgeranyl transferase type-1 subunit beta
MTLGSFAIGGLDQLNALASNVNEERRAGLINWIYAQQVPPQDGPEPFLYCGFRGGPFSGDNSFYNRANIAATFSALVTLLTLGDDLSRVNRQAIIQGLKHLQQEDGRFIPTVGTLESDMRFVYCAAAISFILNDWSGVDREKALDFIWKSQNYDGGFAPGPGQESHGI